MTKSKPHTDVIVAARGWAHRVWCDGFYPDDLPEDWQLAYYSNEFRAVVVPATEFVDVDPLEVERWLGDTAEEFEFYLEVANIFTDWTKFAQAAKPLGKHLKGILLRPPGVDADLAMIAPCLDAATVLAPVSVLLPLGVKLNDNGLDLLAQYQVELCWDTNDGEPAWRGGGFAVARVTGNNDYTPREWREIIESCLRCANGSSEKRKVLLVVEQASPDPDMLRAAMMIGDMLVIPDI